MPGPGDPYIEIYEYTDSLTGHTNLGFFDAFGNHIDTFGANWYDPDNNLLNGIEGGILKENAPRLADHTTRIYVDATTHANMYDEAEAQMTFGSVPYHAFRSNCVDFIHNILTFGGISHDISNMFQGLVLDGYATGRQLLTDGFSALMNAIEFSWTQGLADTIDAALSGFWAGVVALFGGDKQEEAEDNEEELRETAYSPIVIDLNGDGIHTSILPVFSGGVQFDLDGNGYTDRTAWIGADDAFLVRDLNNDGAINNGLEMFGGPTRGEGFAELAALDENSDGIISAADAAFTSLLLWQDLNGNGISESGELRAFSDVGLTEISTDYDIWDVRDHGNLLGERSSVTINGAQSMAVDVYFYADLEYA